MKFIDLYTCVVAFASLSLSIGAAAMHQDTEREQPHSPRSSDQNQLVQQQVAPEKQGQPDPAEPADLSLGKIEMTCDEPPHHREAKAVQGNMMTMMMMANAAASANRNSAANARRISAAHNNGSGSSDSHDHHRPHGDSHHDLDAHGTNPFCKTVHKVVHKVVHPFDHDHNDSESSSDDDE